MRNKIITILICLLLITLNIFAGTIVIETGFEDFTGWDVPDSPANSWPFGNTYEADLTTQSQASLVVDTGDTDCAGAAYSGNSYLHVQKNTIFTDDCLNRISSSVNMEANMGAIQFNYPTGTVNTGRIDTISGKIVTARLRLRVTDNWTSSQVSTDEGKNIDNGGGHKFIRVYGEGGDPYDSDSASVLLKLVNDGDQATPRMVLATRTTGNVWVEVGVNWQDEDWHAVCFRVTRNNDTNSANNITLDLWVDDWDMENAAVATSTGTSDQMGAEWHHIAFSSNWSAEYPASLMGYDIDDIEIWDGEPTEAATPTMSPGTGYTGCTIK